MAASPTKIASLVLFMILFLIGRLIIMHKHNPFIEAECDNVRGGSVHARKKTCMLHVASRKVLKTYSRLHEEEAGRAEEKEMVVLKMTWAAGSELRNVPSGPDPLHHNGGTTKKPKTTP